ncbi:tol-pal system protein YbgF [Allorhizobium sp. BGMRC 0089]|uniref:tol-pal system protein YbgF n=1 Tax=Allorhizobium sonneratiae TaxID=2934936 RepID=UPI002033D89E|nr:tol-pal system protein YbgF [Allorhizobium sonneratiae]MCM2290916.1 tol-pal system protein YbgF [Allorhizobium sonneratiae]
MKRLLVASLVAMSALCVPEASTSAYAFSLFGQQPLTPPEPVGGAPVVQVQQQIDNTVSNELVQIQQLQDQVRQLNGRIEDMSYQLLQMQEQMRKTQEDNEFRFQQLEKKRSDAGGPASPDVASAPQANQSGSAPVSGDTSSSRRDNTAPGETTLGSLDVNKNGDAVGAVIDGSLGDNASGPNATSAQASTGGSEKDLYQTAYNHVLAGDYKSAEAEFKDYISRFPKSARAADAHFWLGEAQYSQNRYRDAAETFLKSYQDYGKSAKAPDMLLKLGMSLAALDNKDTACATLREVPRRYPNASKAILNKASSEQKRLAC